MPLLIASDHILTSTKEGPSHGTLVIGRYLDPSQLSLLSLSTGLPITTSLYNTDDGGPDFMVAKANLSLNHTVYTQPLNETTIAAYALLPDVTGQPLMIVRVDDYRTEYTIGYTGLTYFLIFLVGIAFTVFLVVAVLLDKIVVSRLSALSSAVTKVRNPDNNPKRVKVQGNDELSALSVNINSMLDTIDQQTFTLEHKVSERTKDLAENRKQLESILQASPDAIVAFDMAGNIIECNQRVSEISGYEKSELLGRPGLLSVALQSRDQFVREILPLSENRGPVHSEAYFVRKDGSEVPVEFSANVVLDENENPFGVVAIIRDISYKKQLEQRLIKSQRLAAIGELAGMVGHDIRNPLAAIRNASFYVNKKCGGCENKQVPVMLDVIDRSIDHANSIINDLLEYSRELHLDFSLCTPKTVLAASLRMVKVPKNVSLIDSTSDCIFRADEAKATRVFINMIKNAVDAMPDGGTLKIHSTGQAGTVTVTFSDTGIGIGPDQLQNIFTPLYTTKAQGMGFGLSISKRIIEAHGGSITVNSKLGEGTVFTVNFPVEPKPNADGNSGLFDALT
jgi:PAS domain S-box-containing protein